MRLLGSRPKRTIASAGTLVLTVIAGGACTSGEAASPSARSTPQPASASTTASGEDAVLAVYRSLYPTARKAEQALPGERRRLLEQVATQPLLDRMSRGIAALRATGRVTWGMPVLHPYEVRVEGDRATLHDCQDDTGTGQADDRTGKRLTHGVRNVHLVATLLRGEDGAWRLSTLEQVKEPCSPPS